MAYAVDAAIREQNKRLTANQEGEDDGGDWLSSAAAQRMSLAEPEIGHCREIISKFGGVIREGTAVAIPKQTHNERKNRTYLAVSPDSFRSRSQPSHVIVSAGIAGYKGHKPHAAAWSTPHRRADRQSPFLAPYLEAQGESTEEYTPIKPHAPDRFGHVDQSKLRQSECAALARPLTIRRRAALRAIRLAPPSPPSPSPLFSALMCPSIPVSCVCACVCALCSLSVCLALSLSGSNLPPGYSGHVPRTKGNSTMSFGTSHWRAEKPVTRSQSQAIASQRAQQKGVEAGAIDYMHPDDMLEFQRQQQGGAGGDNYVDLSC